VGGLIETGFDVRAFKAGQYVNTADGFTGYVFEDNGDNEDGPYQVAICEHDEERRCSASELILWAPKAGDSVVEANSENGVQGIVVDIDDDGRSVVKWKCFLQTQTWFNTNLEPALND